MAGLQNGIATVTSDGFLTEPVWREAAPVALTPASDVSAIVKAVAALLADADARHSLARRGQDVYREQFSIERTIDALRADVSAPALAAS
jgi:hypothetical protein